MRLAEPLVWHKRLMLPAGWVLTMTDITSLRRRFPGLTLRVGDPIMDNVVEFEDDRYEREVAQNVQHGVAKSLGEVGKRFAGRTSLKGINMDSIRGAVQQLMEYLKSNPTTAAIVTQCLDSRSYLGAHAGNVFYLSMMLGSAAQEYIMSERQRQVAPRVMNHEFAGDLSSLGLGAMSMDLGMIPLQQLVKENNFLDEEGRGAIWAHPNVGAEALPEGFSALARMVVKTHHENVDGSGYPDRLPGAEVHVFSRVVRIADAFDAGTAEHVFKQARSPARVIWEMTSGAYQRFYDRNLMTIFARLIQPFPIGSKLRLSNNYFGVVVRYNRGTPFEPYVVVAFDPNNQRLPDSRLEGPVRVNSRPDLRLKAFRNEDLSFIYGTSVTEGAAPNRKAIANLFEAAFP
jgi:HD-GYP domain-containing protein (c-di-GMP phosphodiesterase class II)